MLQYLRQLEAADGWRGVNRALLHGLLFVAWASSSGLQKPAAAPADEWAVDSDWRLSTGKTHMHMPGVERPACCAIWQHLMDDLERQPECKACHDMQWSLWQVNLNAC
jgi:hypothetical protein